MAKDGFFDHGALREFILAQMKRNDMSQHDFAKHIGVSQPTIQRFVTFGSNYTPPTPTLEFMVKLARGTNTELSTLIANVIPGSGTIDGRTAILMQQIARLPERQREAAEILLRGLLLESGEQE